MLPHGGNLKEAERKFGASALGWLDLSTGISPFAYPVGEIDARLWNRLPDGMDELKAAAARYYGAKSLTAVGGTQAAIQILPRLRSRSTVAVLSPAYEEHAFAWQRAGHMVSRAGADKILECGLDYDVVVVVNPNNPTADIFEKEDLIDCLGLLQERGGWLVVDEAFIDTRDYLSLSDRVGEPGLVVLRSPGKAFGLAGARVGFVLAWSGLIQSIEDEVGPWPLSGPSMAAVSQALSDRKWQNQAFDHLEKESLRLVEVLLKANLPVSGSTSLFSYVKWQRAGEIQSQLAANGIWVRLFEEPAALRFGLPGCQANWQRLEAALAKLTLT